MRPVARMDWGGVGGVPLRSGVGGAAFASAVLEAEAVAVHLQDVDVVGEPIQQRRLTHRSRTSRSPE